jgi:hypothetical protein
MPLTIVNVGTQVLNVTSVSSDDAAFTPDRTSFSIPEHQSAKLVVRFDAGAAHPYSGTLTIRSDDPDEPEVHVTLAGEGLIPPDITVAPTTVTETLFTGGVKTRALTIGNQGGSPLDFTVHVEGIPGVTAALVASEHGAAAMPDGRTPWSGVTRALALPVRRRSRARPGCRAVLRFLPSPGRTRLRCSRRRRRLVTTCSSSRVP